MRKKVGIGCGVVLAMLVVLRVGLGVWASARMDAYDVQWQKDVAAEHARVAAIRMPVLRGDPLDEDATARYHGLLPKVEKVATAALGAAVASTSVAGPLAPGALELLEAHRQTIKDLREATRCTRVLWPEIRIEDGGEAKIPGLVPLRNLGNLLVLEGRERAIAADARGAAERFLDGSRFAADVGQAPTLITTMIALALEAPALTALGELLVSDVPGIPHAQIAAELAKLEPCAPDVWTGLKGEQLLLGTFRKLGFRDLQLTQQLGSDERGISPVDVLLPSSALFASAQAELDAFWKGAAKTAGLPRGERDKAIQALVDETLKSSNPIVQIVLPNVVPAIRRGDRGRAHRVVVATLVQLESKRAADGTYPKEPELPVDPCSDAGDKLRYEPTADGRGYKLWSVGDETSGPQKKGAIVYERKSR